MTGLLLTTPRAWLRRALRPGAPSPLAGRTVLVTGASSGIGEATAHAAAARGATVLLVARRADALADVARAVRAAGGRAHAYPCDLTDGPAVDRLVATVLAEHGGVDYWSTTPAAPSAARWRCPTSGPTTSSGPWPSTTSRRCG